MRTTALVAALALALAPLAARAQEAPLPPVPPAEAVKLPGQLADVRAGAPAPFDGALADAERWAYVKSLRRAAEKERDDWKNKAQDATSAKEKAENERDSRVSWGALLGVAGGALVLGIVAGVVGVAVIQDRAAK